WGGYRLAPSYFEFWHEREFRLHDRVTYRQGAGTQGWSIERICP
ncbi:MAG: pyridoxamine 5'-phosphate oxidase, partial [Alphaproteobacteria bacterium]|nr:pyridoxamine 5'-phosphate oxidase [Alphaproteobacteria bacterium]